MDNENEETTMRLKKVTRNRLADRGSKDDTFDNIIKALLDATEGSK